MIRQGSSIEWLSLYANVQKSVGQRPSGKTKAPQTPLESRDARSNSPPPKTAHNHLSPDLHCENCSTGLLWELRRAINRTLDGAPWSKSRSEEKD